MKATALNTVRSLIERDNLVQSKLGVMNYSAGSRIFEQGEDGDCAYMIDHGYVEVALSAGGKQCSLAILGPGEIFGEMALLDGHPRSATVTALHDTVLISISRKQLLDAINGGTPLARLLLIASLDRLRKTQAQNQNADEPSPPGARTRLSKDPGHAAARAYAVEQIRLRFELENAIAKRQLQLAYQPIVCLADGRTAGFEALVRWPRPDLPPAPPTQFISLAEDTGLIIPLGLLILEQALDALSNIERRLRLRGKDPTGIFMSINVSPNQLDSETNVEQLARTIEQSDVDPTRIKLEITEQVLLGDPRLATIGLSRLKATGASIAIDDFGTGYSSLNYLRRFPIDTIKIDRSFVSTLVEDRSAQHIVAAIIGLARDLEMEVVAEGIEEIDELRWLQSHACHYGQGFLMAKPSPFATALGHLERDFEW